MIAIVAPLAVFALAVVGWSVAHFLWQGAIIGAVVEAAVAVLQRARPAVRERVALAGILCLVTVFAATAVRLGEHAVAGERSTAAKIEPSDSAPAAVTAERRSGSSRLPTPTALPSQPSPPTWAASAAAAIARRAMATAAPCIGLAWIVIVVWRVTGLVSGARRLRLIQARAAVPVEGAAAAACERIAKRMRVRRAVPIFVSPEIDVPTLVGWRSPAILLPQSAAGAISEAALASIVAHELAHVRRGDMLAQAVQVGARALLCFHPATHRLGRIVERERERCCDDRAVEACAAPLLYARTLARLERLRPPVSALAVAMDSAPLLDRIRRIVQPEPMLANRRALPVAAAAIAVAAAATHFAARAASAADIDTSGVRAFARHFVEHGAGPGPAHHGGGPDPAPAPGATRRSAARAMIEQLDRRDYRASDVIRIRLGDEVRDPLTLADFVALASDPVEETRDKALWLLGTLGDRRAAPRAIEALGDPSPRVRHTAAWALGMLRDARAFEPLLAALHDRDSRARAGAAWALGRLGDARAVEALAQAADDSSPDVRHAARASLAALGDPRASPDHRGRDAAP